MLYLLADMHMREQVLYTIQMPFSNDVALVFLLLCCCVPVASARLFLFSARVLWSWLQSLII